MMKKPVVLLLLIFSFRYVLSQHIASKDTSDFIAVKSKVYTNGAVSCAHPLAAEVGANILKKGGNAFDAAIATQLALAVVYPQAGNIGGGGFLTARNKDGKLIALDYREKAPSEATRDMYLDSNGIADTHLSQDGHLSAGVPGSVAGFFAIYKYARLPFKELIQPAIDLARNGFAITAFEAALLNRFKDDFITYNGNNKVSFVKDSLWKAGDLLIQPELAKTLELIRDKGKKGFYEGETAKLIADEMQRGHGIISLKDLKNYEAKDRVPLQFDYEGYKIISFPPPSSGGLLLEQMMKMTALFDLKKLGFHTAASIHVMAEAERRAFADRAKFMGDPDFWKVPDSALINDNYLKQRMRSFDPNKATPSDSIGAGNPYESHQTTHICIADKEGNLVSVTTTLNGLYGSRVVVKGAGFLLNDEMDDFSVKPGVPNMFGAVGGEANAIAPNKRMLSSMCPTLVLRDNRPFMIVGTPGGTTIPTSVFQSIVNVIDFGMGPAEAVNAPKFHHQWLPDEIIMEEGFDDKVINSLNAMNYKIDIVDGIGRNEMILFEKGKLHAVADIRGNDGVDGY
ncbi:MAG: gamma-glutamyltransferase [Arachidicoccus sp.]|nr:gamma-glutamyltransferase [Arachidicoccus sp.]